MTWRKKGTEAKMRKPLLSVQYSPWYEISKSIYISVHGYGWRKISCAWRNDYIMEVELICLMTTKFPDENLHRLYSKIETFFDPCRKTICLLLLSIRKCHVIYFFWDEKLIYKKIFVAVLCEIMGETITSFGEGKGLDRDF